MYKYYLLQKCVISGLVYSRSEIVIKLGSLHPIKANRIYIHPSLQYMNDIDCTSHHKILHILRLKFSSHFLITSFMDSVLHVISSNYLGPELLLKVENNIAVKIAVTHHLLNNIHNFNFNNVIRIK